MGGIDGRPSRPLARAWRWVFEDRTTGRIVIAQWPNLPLWLFVAAAAVRRLATPEGTVGTVVDAIALAALVWWAVDEIVRGVNPWRRFLGATVLVGAMVTRLL